MATFSAVNTALSAPEPVRSGDEHTPTTPKPGAGFAQNSAMRDARNDDSAPTTPTRQTFGGIPGQRPLPDEPLTPKQSIGTPQGVDRSLSQRGLQDSPASQHVDAMQDVEMADGDDDMRDDEDGSDNDSVTSDSQRPSKKKKGQRFFCTEFPPCQLSFTRSEHLARHIRKHTGERPFQCHCSRRFSRLDNLRQHAQTVHVNEDIPGDSLAATSTRFQRQIRTDRVRPPNSRSRASTIGSNGGGSRGHSRNLSTSSIGSTTSSIGLPEEARRRPQPLAMANDPSARARLTLDTFSNTTGSPGQSFAYYNQSPTGYSTPTSTTFSNGPGSPHFGSNMASPVSSLSRSSFYNGARHGRRLSVPSAQNPYQNPSGHTYPPPMYYSTLSPGQSMASSQNSSVFASPTSSVFSHGRRDSETDLEYRRRTWHPGTYANYTQRPATSGLSYHQTVDDQRPALSDQPAASQVTRLPGIESFDHVPPPVTRQQSSPMSLDASIRPAGSGRPLDAGLHQGLTRLDISAANGLQDSQWQSAAAAPPGPQLAPAPAFISARQPQTMAPQNMHQHPLSMPEPPVTPRRNKRQAWYGGPVTSPNTPSGPPAPYPAHPGPAQRPSPEDSGSSDGVPTPGNYHGGEIHPVIVTPQGSGPGEPLVPQHPHAAVAPPLGDEGQQQKVLPANRIPVLQHAITDISRGQTYVQTHQHPRHAAQPPQTYSLQAGHDPRVDGGYTHHHHHHPQPNHDMGRLEALVAVATSENRAVERS